MSTTKPQPEIAAGYAALAGAYHSAGEHVDAETWWRRALAGDDSMVGCHVGLARTLAELGRLDEAEGHLRRALALDPLCDEAARIYAEICRWQGRLSEAARLFLSALVRGAAGAVHLGYAELTWALGAVDDAEKHYRRALHHADVSAEACADLGVLLVTHSRPEGGRAAPAARRRPAALSRDADEPRERARRARQARRGRRALPRGARARSGLRRGALGSRRAREPSRATRPRQPTSAAALSTCVPASPAAVAEPESRVEDRPSIPVALMRVVVGAAFIVIAFQILSEHAQSTTDFQRWGFSSPSTFSYAFSGVTIVFALILILGILPRFAALVLLAEMVVATLTAGRIDHGPVPDPAAAARRALPDPRDRGRRALGARRPARSRAAPPADPHALAGFP